VKERALALLACPRCAGDLALRADERDGSEVMTGALGCSQCVQEYPVRGGVPRFADDPAESIRQRTQRSFGFEWTVYSRWGLEGRLPSETDERRRAIEREAFETKALVDPREFEGKVVLDAGCGNGRYTFQALELGGEVVGIDLSDAVDAAFANVGRHPKGHVVQGDLFQPPFPAGRFDRIFSIGVLMHTGDAEKVFHCLAETLAPEGVFSVHVYRRGNPVYEAVDGRLRRRTTAMELEDLMCWSHRVEWVPKAVYATRHVTLGRPILYQLLNSVVRLEFGHHYIFDWYSAPAASHHTYPEVHSWYGAAGLRVVSGREEHRGVLRRLIASPASGVTVKGRRPAAS
jgi:SAM-dependent methyltransferase